MYIHVSYFQKKKKKKKNDGKEYMWLILTCGDPYQSIEGYVLELHFFCNAKEIVKKF